MNSRRYRDNTDFKNTYNNVKGKRLYTHTVHIRTVDFVLFTVRTLKRFFTNRLHCVAISQQNRKKTRLCSLIDLHIVLDIIHRSLKGQSQEILNATFFHLSLGL